MASYFVHLSSEADPDTIVESLKLPSYKDQLTVAEMRKQVVGYLDRCCNDGNKIYEALRVRHAWETEFHNDESALLTVGDGDDFFMTVNADFDRTKSVRPLLVQEKAPALKYKTVTKYQFSESGAKYVKVDLTELAGLPKDKPVEVEFENRSVSVRVHDWKDANWQFTVPRLQCKILPPDSSWLIKDKYLQLKLRKKKEDDVWHSLFKTKAIGERDSDESN